MNTSEVLSQSFGLYVFITLCARFLSCLSTGTLVHCIVMNSSRQQTLRHLTDFLRGWYRPHIAQAYLLMIVCERKNGDNMDLYDG